jgi:predicted RNA-binding Zn-ribbon protein involved in translation (DUF1610 family)
MPNTHDTKDLCPLCEATMLRHAHCRFVGCTFHVTTCPTCDREQAVRAFVSDHEKDCALREVATQPFLRVRAA